MKTSQKILSILFTSALLLNGCSQSNLSNTDVLQNQQVNSLANNKVNASERDSYKILLSMFESDPDIQSKKNSYNPLFAKTGVSINDIQQGKRPVCYFLAATAGLALQRPEEVKKMVKQNSDGSYNVMFPGLPSTNKNINVESLSNSELGHYIYKGKNNSTWVAVSVKAIAQYWSKRGILRFFRDNKDAANYGPAWEGIQILTGNRAKALLVSATSDQKLLQEIDKAIKSKKVVTTSTTLKGKKAEKVNDIYISIAHVFTVLGVNFKNNTITVRDPYGGVKRLQKDGSMKFDKSKNGVMTFSVSDFKKYYTDVAIETDKKVTSLSRLKYMK